jgi:rubrerythrin
MPAKPSYLGLLNAIALAECRAHAYLTVWAEKTPSADVRKVLLTVAAREGEHGMSFAKRINELGYEVRQKDDPNTEKVMAIASSDLSDLEKMQKLKLHELDTGSAPDIFDDFFKDHSIDIRTGELLGRYIAEERDTARLLRSCYEQLQAASRSDGAPTSADAISALDTKVDALCRAVEELRQIVCAQSMSQTP